uniref:Uncharacterized protein n=1 Tax=Davidia involucrata TaxID=16924 RepID=A0A5B7BAM2_DAVIN
MRTKGSNQSNRFMRIITIPIRVLSKAKDFYVRSMTDCAERVSYGNVMGGPAGGQVSSLPKSFSVNSSRSNDSDELIRTTSARRSSMGINRVELDLYMQQQMRQQQSTVVVVPRSCSVGMGRIDEDRPCDFGEDNHVHVKPDLFYPRSRSYAVTKRSVVY